MKLVALINAQQDRSRDNSFALSRTAAAQRSEEEDEWEATEGRALQASSASD